ncbi:hypothetical protein HA402_008349 [Bradysia odoriphaga]|nr:hypothetical protein HA402_008349 [Bradysia odoriphaga]
MNPDTMLKPALVNVLNRLGIDSSGTREQLRSRLKAHLRTLQSTIAMPPTQRHIHAAHASPNNAPPVQTPFNQVPLTQNLPQQGYGTLQVTVNIDSGRDVQCVFFNIANYIAYIGMFMMVFQILIKDNLF